jgi:hypothetical protein
MKTLGVDTVGLGRHLLLTYNFNASSKGRSKTSVAKARLYLFSSMAEIFLSKGTCNNDLLVCLLPRVLNQQYYK